jgi:hypothetical protein
VEFGVQQIVLGKWRIHISRLSDRDCLLGIIASDTDIKETSDFTVIDNFGLLCEFRDDRVSGGVVQRCCR